MPITHLARRAAAGALGLLAVATGLTTAAGPAGAVAASGWSVSQTLGPARGVWDSTLIPDSASDAWVTWNAIGQHHLVERWTGSSWSQVPVPAADLPVTNRAVAFGASSASNAWFFDHGVVLRWDGTQWNKQTIPSWVVAFSRSGNYFASTEVFSPTDVWVFSAEAAHYDGHTWTKVALPGSLKFQLQATAVSADDMWVLGATSHAATPTFVLDHWDGTQWTSTPVPSVTPPAGTSESVSNLTASGPADVWLQRTILRHPVGIFHPLYLLHWNGTGWTHVKLGFPTSAVSLMAPDGSGGLWLVANGKKPASTMSLDHYSAGQWSQTSMPPATGLQVLDITGMTWVPGTQSLWATGNETGGNHIFGTTWSFSP